MPSFWEITFLGVMLWVMWEFFKIVEEQEKWNREDELRREKRSGKQ